LSNSVRYLHKYQAVERKLKRQFTL